jgi:hypothetical protein
MARLFVTNERRNRCDEDAAAEADPGKRGWQREIPARGERTDRDESYPRVRRLAVILPSGYRDLGG